jgi:hypothetical protein
MNDNGPHYHCSKMMAKWAEWYDIECKKWCFLETGEAMTFIDIHHAQVIVIFTSLLYNSTYSNNSQLFQFNQSKISHAIKRYVRLKFDLSTGEDIEKALDGLSGTSTAYLKPNCDQRNQSNVKTIPGIFNWFFLSGHG